MDTIKISDIMDYCKKVADESAECLQKAFECERNGTRDMAAVAFFMENENMFRYTIPGMIRRIADELEEKMEKIITVRFNDERQAVMCEEALRDASGWTQINRPTLATGGKWEVRFEVSDENIEEC